MVAFTLNDFIYLLPILILGCAIVILLFLLLLLKVNTKISAIFAVSSLSLALLSSSFLGYQIMAASTNQLTLSNAIVFSDEIAEPYNQLVVVEDSEVIDNGHTDIDDFNEVVAIGPDSPVVVTDSIESSFADQHITDETISESTVVENDASILWAATYVTALFTCDGYGLLYTSLILFVCIVVATLAFNWFHHDKQRADGLFYLILLFSALGATTLIYASHLISLFIGIELLSIPIVGLIGYQYTQKHSLEAAVKYMVLSAVSTTFLLLGIAFYYAATGELTFSGLSFQLSTLAFPSTLSLLGVCLMLVGVGFKLSLVPFQLWLPDVYQGAPACVSLLLTTVSKVAVFCAIARLFLLAPIVNNETIRIIMVAMAFCSIILGNIFAINQHNIKRLLAYSSISQFGYLLIALIAVQYQVLALETIGIYLIGYILANICVFSVISLESSSSATQDHENEIDLCGLFWRRPIIALAMGIGLLSLAGIPLTVGFIGRFSLILLGVTAELWWLVGAVVVGSAFGLYYYSRLVINLFIKPRVCQQQEGVATVRFKFSDIGLSEVFIVFSALTIMLCGIYPKWLFNLVTLAQYLMPQ